MSEIDHLRDGALLKRINGIAGGFAYLLVNSRRRSVNRFHPVGACRYAYARCASGRAQAGRF